MRIGSNNVFRIESRCVDPGGHRPPAALKVAIDRLAGRRGQASDLTPSSETTLLNMAKGCSEYLMKVQAQDLFKGWHGWQLNYVPNVLWRNLRSKLYPNRAKLFGWHCGRLGGLGAPVRETWDRFETEPQNDNRHHFASLTLAYPLFCLGSTWVYFGVYTHSR